MSKSSRTGGELLVKCLANLGVKTGFGVPGESYLAVLDALYDADISFTLCRHESAAGFAGCGMGQADRPARHWLCYPRARGNQWLYRGAYRHAGQLAHDFVYRPGRGR